jgi:hypothetical protein
MYVPLTIAVLGLLTGAMILVRFFWWRLPNRLRMVLLAIACISTMLPVISIATRWSTTSDKANAVLHWSAVAGYQLILMRFSLLRPQWLTSFCAVILIVPTFGASLLLPLTEIFPMKHRDVFEIGGRYLYERVPWDTTGTEVPGFTLMVYTRPRFAPFLRHRIQQSAFNAGECQASESSASILAETRQVLFHCPAKPGQQDIEHILPLN